MLTHIKARARLCHCEPILPRLDVVQRRLESTLLRVFDVLFCHDPKRARTRTGKIEINRGVAEKGIAVRFDPEYAQLVPFAHKVAMAVFRKPISAIREVVLACSRTSRWTSRRVRTNLQKIALNFEIVLKEHAGGGSLTQIVWLSDRCFLTHGRRADFSVFAVTSLPDKGRVVGAAGERRTQAGSDF